MAAASTDDSEFRHESTAGNFRFRQIPCGSVVARHVPSGACVLVPTRHMCDCSHHIITFKDVRLPTAKYVSITGSKRHEVRVLYEVESYVKVSIIVDDSGSAARLCVSGREGSVSFPEFDPSDVPAVEEAFYDCARRMRRV